MTSAGSLLSRAKTHSVFRYALASLIPRSLAILTALLITPLAIDRLGAVEYGYWVLATQIPNLIVSPDLGLGQGIINEVSRVQRRDGNISSYHRRLLGLVKLLFAIAAGWLLIGTGGVILYVSASTNAGQQSWTLLTALVLALACFTSGVPATVWTRTQLAQERGHVAVLWEGGGKLVTLLSCISALTLTNSLLLLVVASLLPSSIALWLNALFYVRREFSRVPIVPWPPMREALAHNRQVFSVGKYFIVMNVCYVLGVALDPYLVNLFLSTQDVTYLNITRRPYEMLPLVVALYSTSLWPVFARLHANGEWSKLKQLTIGVASCGMLFVAAMGVLIIVFRDRIYNFLGQGYIHPPIADLLWVTVHMSAITGVLVLTNFLSAISVIRAQAAIMLLAAVLAMATKILVLLYGGIHAFIWAVTLSYVLPLAIPIFVLSWRRLFIVRSLG